MSSARSQIFVQARFIIALPSPGCALQSFETLFVGECLGRFTDPDRDRGSVRQAGFFVEHDCAAVDYVAEFAVRHRVSLRPGSLTGRFRHQLLYCALLPNRSRSTIHVPRPADSTQYPMILSGNEIRRQLGTNIKIDPFEERQL